MFFAWGQFFTISFCSALLAGLLGAVSGVKINHRVVVISGFLPLLLLILGFVSFALDNGGAHASGTELVRVFRMHLFLLMYAFSLGVIHNLINFNSILKWVSAGVVFSAVYGLADYFLQNYFNVSFDSYVYRYSVQENTGSLADLFRLRSTFAEPGLFAFYLAILAPWTLIYLRYRYGNLQRTALGIVIFASFLLTFSGTGYAILVLLTFLLAFREKKLIWLLPTVCVLLAIMSVELFQFSDYAQRSTLFLGKYGLETGGEADSSLVDRSMRIETGIGLLKYAWNNEDLVAIFFGHGPGWGTAEFGAGFVNVYLYLLIAFGALGFLCMIIFLITVWWKIVRRQGSLIFYSFFAIILSFAAIQSYYELIVIFVFSLLAVVPKNIQTSLSVPINKVVNK